VAAQIKFPGPTLSSICGMCLFFSRASADSLWVPLNYGFAVARIDPTTNKIVATVKFKLPPFDLAIGDDGSVWVAAGADEGCQGAGNIVARIDPTTNTIAGTLPIQCAESIAVEDGDVWVGVGDPDVNMPNKVIRIKPAP